MSGPKHLWSGDWRRDSVEARAKLARLRSHNEQAEATVAPAPTEPPPSRRQADPPPSRRQADPAGSRRQADPAGSRRQAPTLATLRAYLIAALAGARTRLAAVLATGRARGTATLAAARAHLTAARRERPRVASARRPADATRRRRRVAVASLAAVVLVAGGAYGLTTALGSGSPATATGPAPWMGVQLQSLPVGGAVVVTVAPGGPAEAAGLEPGDVITTIDNQPVNSAADVSSELAPMHAGDEVEIGISRGSTLLTIPLTLASRPSGSP